MNPKTLKRRDLTLFRLSLRFQNVRKWQCSAERCVLATPIFNICGRLARYRFASDARGGRLCTDWKCDLDAVERSTTAECDAPGHTLGGRGIFLIVGLWTPIAGVSVAITEVWKMLMLHGDKPGWLLLGTVGAALAMLGPGLWSVDARLYGWKRLEPTPRKKV